VATFIARPLGDGPGFSLACINTPVLDFPDPAAGIHFYVEDTACDSFGNDLSESVLAARMPGGRKKLLFKYSPDDRNPPPRITVEGGKTIVIQVDGSVDVSYQAATLGSYSIRSR